MEKFTLGLIVNNSLGVLARVACLFNKRGCNIESLAVEPTKDGAHSQMTIVSMGDSYTRTQVLKQLNKLIDVKAVDLVEADEAEKLDQEPEEPLVE